MSVTETSGTGVLSDESRRLVEQNLPLVEHITNRVAASFPRHIDRDELSRAGMLGLVEAAARFDPERGRFATFAGRRIEGAILDEIRRRTWAPRSVRGRAQHLAQLEDELAQVLGRQPTGAELAQSAGLTLSELAAHRARADQGWVDSLDRPAGGDAERSLADMVVDRSAEPDAGLEDRELRAYLRSAIAALPERHRMVIVGYFLEQRPMDELAQVLGVTQSRVSQLKDYALELMRTGIEAQYQEGGPPSPVTRAQRSRASYASAVAAIAARGTRLLALPGRPDPDPVAA
jgi:RNA polymerase sigma factor for flagellar operon FliA